MTRKKFSFFVLIFILFLQSRFLYFSQVPQSVYWDEASIGYNAYSVMLTGKDEVGEVLPLHFRAFGEFKLPVYIYSVIPFIKLFGLTSVAVRLPAVIYSALSVVLVYLLAKAFANRESIALFSAFLFAISKWYFIFSRTGYEATAGLFFFLVFIYAAIKARKNTAYLPIVVFAQILAAYSYNSFRLLSTVLLLVYLMYLLISVKLRKQTVFHLGLAVLLFLVSLTPIYRLYTKDTGLARFGQVQGESANIVGFTKAYLSHFTPEYLFLSGDKNLRSNVGFGELYKVELVFLVFGLVYVLKKRNLTTTLPLLLLLLAIIPAAITKEYPHALRSLGAAPFFAMISAYGIYQIGKFLKDGKRMLYYSLVVFALLLSFENYLIEYFVRYPKKSAQDWQYQYKQVFEGYKGEFANYDKVVVTSTGAQPYIFALFYLGYDPEDFRQQVVYNLPNSWGFSKVEKFGKFEFIESTEYDSGTLIFSEEEKIMGKDPTESIYYPDGSVALNVFAI